MEDTARAEAYEVSLPPPCVGSRGWDGAKWEARMSTQVLGVQGVEAGPAVRIDDATPTWACAYVDLQ
jgi:hypothetical protein